MATVQILNEWALFHWIIRWPFTLWRFNFVLARQRSLVIGIQNPNSNLKSLRMRPKCPTPLHCELSGECVVLNEYWRFLEWLLPMALTETVGKLGVNWLSSSPLLSSQALSSPLSTSSDCNHCHTTANELSAFAYTSTGGYICSASW